VVPLAAQTAARRAAGERAKIVFFKSVAKSYFATSSRNWDLLVIRRYEHDF